MKKLCITCSIENCYPKALVVFRGIEDSLRQAAELGYSGVELALYRKDNIDVGEVKKLLTRYGMEIPVVSTGQMFTMLEVWFTHPEAAVRRKAVEEFKGIIDVASEFGADINVSRVRGHIHEDDAYADGIRKLTDCLEPICKHAAGYGLDILLEQMNRYETNYMHSVSQVGDYIESSGISNLKIHADLFHMNIEDACMEESLEKYKDLLGYIHFADSNRLAPGQGHLDFPDVLKTLDAIGYSGWIGIEVLTEPDAYTAAKQSIDYLKDISKPRYRP